MSSWTQNNHSTTSRGTALTGLRQRLATLTETFRQHPRLCLALFLLAVAIVLTVGSCGHDFGPNPDDSGFWF